MTSPIPTRFNDDEVAILDSLVAAGLGKSRSEVIRRAIAELDSAFTRAIAGKSIADSYRLMPQTSDDDTLAMANAIAMTESEPW